MRKNILLILVTITTIILGVMGGGFAFSLWSDNVDLQRTGTFPRAEIKITNPEDNTTWDSTTIDWSVDNPQYFEVPVSAADAEAMVRGDIIYKEFDVEWLFHGRNHLGIGAAVITDPVKDYNTNSWLISDTTPCGQPYPNTNPDTPLGILNGGLELLEERSLVWRDYATPKTGRLCVAMEITSNNPIWDPKIYENIMSVASDQGATGTDSWTAKIYPDAIYNMKLRFRLNSLYCGPA